MITEFTTITTATILEVGGSIYAIPAIRYLQLFTYRHKEGTKVYCEKFPLSSQKYSHQVLLHLSTGLGLMSFKDLGYQPGPIISFGWWPTRYFQFKGLWVLRDVPLRGRSWHCVLWIRRPWRTSLRATFYRTTKWWGLVIHKTSILRLIITGVSKILVNFFHNSCNNGTKVCKASGIIALFHSGFD